MFYRVKKKRMMRLKNISKIYRLKQKLDGYFEAQRYKKKLIKRVNDLLIIFFNITIYFTT
jgi:hypothetical protein